MIQNHQTVLRIIALYGHRECWACKEKIEYFAVRFDSTTAQRQTRYCPKWAKCYKKRYYLK